ncbi:MAG: cell division protein ZipA [Thalassotalea sp.]
MEYDIRTALMIISAIAIFAILLHGMWKIRKNRNPYKLKTKTENIGPLSRNFDGSGFDQDGVGQIKAISGNALTGEIEHPPEDHEIPHQPAPAPEFNIDPIPKDVVEKEKALAAEPEVLPADKIESFEVTQQPIVVDDQDLIPEMETPDNINEVLQAKAENSQLSENIQQDKAETAPVKAVYDTPVSNPKPESVKPLKKINRKRSKSDDQLGFNFGESLSFEDDEEPVNTAAQPEEKPMRKVDIEPEVIVLTVIMPENQMISGAALLPTLLTLGMKYGEMNIFHRHQDNAGNGKVTFSLANMMNPGTFDLDAMESFSTQGVSLFMTLPNPGDAFLVFDQMLGAAKQIAQEFRGQLLDDKRSVMTKQTEQHYISKIREFDRKYRIAAN